MVDTVASLGCMPFEMDALGIGRRDVGLANGPDDARGLRLCSPPATSRPRGAQKSRPAQPYWDWTEREAPSITAK